MRAGALASVAISRPGASGTAARGVVFCAALSWMSDSGSSRVVETLPSASVARRSIAGGGHLRRCSP